jgi:DNA repair protein RadC
MSPAERAGLLRHGVVYTVIQHLESAGYDLERLSKATVQQLAAVPGVGTLGAYQVQRGLTGYAEEMERARSAQ